MVYIICILYSVHCAVAREILIHNNVIGGWMAGEVLKNVMIYRTFIIAFECCCSLEFLLKKKNLENFREIVKRFASAFVKGLSRL